MKYSSGNHRKGTGRTRQRARGVVSPAPYTEASAKIHLAQLQRQVAFATSAGLNVSPYEMKIAEILTQFPQLAEGAAQS